MRNRLLLGYDVFFFFLYKAEEQFKFEQDTVFISFYLRGFNASDLIIINQYNQKFFPRVIWTRVTLLQSICYLLFFVDERGSRIVISCLT